MENYKNVNIMNWETGKVTGFKGKSLIDLENGGLKMVKVEAQASYPEHLHPNKTEYVYVLNGSPKITIGAVEHNGSEGDFFILPKSIKHSIINSTNTECLLLVGAISH